MSRNEITMRLLSAEAKVPLHHMRNGKMTDEDWARLARKMGRSPRPRSSSTTRRTSP
jgi:replicative DNA helicase